MNEPQCIRVLLIEDDEIDREAIRRYFTREKLPYVLHTATNEKEALLTLHNQEHDVIILDYNLKESSGLDLIPHAKLTPVILITGGGNEEIAVEAMRRGAYDYLVKDSQRHYLNLLPIAIRNVMERKKAEMARFESEEKLRSTLDSISDLVFSMDIEGRFIDFHHPSDHQDQYAAPEFFIGKFYHEVMPPTLVEEMRITIQNTLETGRGQKLNYSLDIQGELRWFEATYSIRRNRQGQPIGLTAVVRNITEQKNTEDALKKAHALLEQRVEERTAELKATNLKLEHEIQEREKSATALKKSEARLSAFMNSATEAFLLVDDQFCFVDVNKLGLELLKVDRKQVLGAPVVSIFKDLYKSGRYQLYQSVLKTGEPVTIDDFVLKTPHGTLNGIIKAFKVDDMLGIIMIDTTRRKALEEQLRQAQKMEAIGSLAGGIAHDFNNILGIIIGYTELALDDIQPDCRAWNNIQQVMTAAIRGREIIKQILAFSRKEAHETKPISLKNLLEAALKIVRATLPEGIEVLTHFQERLHPILANPTQIHQVILNICANATHAMKEKGGTLDISLQEITFNRENLQLKLQPGIYQKITFQDSGYGIKPEFIRRVMEPYFTTKEPGEGSGLGLAVVHGILRNHHGDIAIHSQPGEGTCIQIYLPILETPIL